MIAHILTGLVALEAIYIMYLEMFGAPAQQSKAFEVDEKILMMPEVKSLFGNQGVYNGLFGALILATLFLLQGDQQNLMLILEMLFVLLAAIYGSFTAARKIIFVQGLPALIALVALLIL